MHNSTIIFAVVCHVWPQIRKKQFRTTGGDLGKGMGNGPSKIWGVDGPCIRYPNISRIAGIYCEAKYELTNNGLREEFRVVKLKFLAKKGQLLLLLLLYFSD